MSAARQLTREEQFARLEGWQPDTETLTECAAEFAELDAAMAVGVGREEFQRGAQMQSSAGEFTIAELVIRDRRAQQPEIEIPIAGVVIEQVHRIFHRFVRFEKFAAIEQLDTESQLRVELVHRDATAENGSRRSRVVVVIGVIRRLDV